MFEKRFKNLIVIKNILLLRIIAFSLLMAYLSAISLASQSQENLSVAEQSNILRSLFAMDLNDPALIEQALPSSWLQPNAELSEERKAAETRLLGLRDRLTTEPELSTEVDLLVLQIQWLKLSPQARAKHLSEIKARQSALSSERKGSQLIAEALQESAESSAAEESITQQVNAAEDERESTLLKRRLTIEQEKQKLVQAKARLGEIQQSFAANFDKWKKLESEIYKAVEADSFDFIEYRPELRRLLRESNDRVKQRQTFETYALGEIATLSPSLDFGEAAARSADTDEVKLLIQESYEAIINLSASYELFFRERDLVLVKHIQWEQEYRHNILAARGSIIQRLKSTSFNLASSEPLLQEGRTVVSSIMFGIWTFKPLYLQQSTQNNRSAFQAFYDYANLLKVLLFVSVAILMLVKKAYFISKINKVIERLTIKNKRYTKTILFEIVEGLYVFFVLLLLGNLFIEFALTLGLTFVADFKPILITTLYFFLGWGFIDILRPVMSQRRFRKNANIDEVKAIEIIFAAIPKIVLLYFLINALTNQALYLWLNESFITDVMTGIYRIVIVLVLLTVVWFKRVQWRLVADKAVDAPYLDRILTASVDRFWEPVVLVFAGGIGVYLITWRMIKSRISELEFTRSFQAMVSRALLERRRRNTTVRVIVDRFPDGYLRDFSYETRALPDWHVERQEGVEKLQQAYERWQLDKYGTTVLIAGDRGVGKSELIYQFLRVNEIKALECKLQPGDSSLEEVLATLSLQLLGKQEALSVEEFEKALNELEPSVILLENLENSILRQVDGFDAYAKVIDLIMATSGRHLWLVTFTTYAWTIARRAVPGSDCFSQYFFMRGMGEEEIKQLIMRRHAENKIIKLNFSGLSLEGMASQRKNITKQELEERRENLYFRILWDYTGGNPRQALYFWKTSLEFVGGEARVNLFEVPEQNVLEKLRDKSLMLLAALVEHNGLTVDGLAAVLNESKNNVRRWVEEVMPYGIIYSFGDPSKEDYGWHIESFWISATEAYLIKRQLLFHGGLK